MSLVDTGLMALRRPSATDRHRARAIVEGAGIFRPSEVEIALEVFGDAVEMPGKDYWALGAFADERMVGFACYGATPGTVGTWDLYWIAVDPRARRRGAGRRLMQACEDAIQDQGGRLVVVETASRPDYAATRGFYESIGYQRAARIPDYYAPEDDLVIYTKWLVPPTTERHHG